MELSYGIDNFSGRYNRGKCYDIKADGCVNVPEEAIDRLCEEMGRKSYLITIE